MVKSELNLLFGALGSDLLQRLHRFYRRFPQLLPREIFHLFTVFFSRCPFNFTQTHSSALIRRILFSQCRLAKKEPIGKEQHIDLYLVAINPSTFGISLSLISNQDRLLDREEILKGVQQLISGTKLVPHSYFFLPKNEIIGTDLYYLEIEKMRGGLFYKEERERLSVELPRELKKGLESAFLSLFVPGNEEELFKNIRHLSQEIKYIRDLPQVMISFVEYLPDRIKFLVIALRLLKKNTPSIQSLSSRLPPLIHFSLEETFLLDLVRNKYPKEAALFTLEVKSSLFLRRNQVVNLRGARQYIAKVVERMLGPFRDYNGGLLCKENEQLLSIKKGLDEAHLSAFFLEDLFYSVKPATLRSLLRVKTGIELVVCINKLVNDPLASNQNYLLATHFSQELELVVVKTKNREWKHSLPKKILNDVVQAGYASVEVEAYTYLCFFRQFPENASRSPNKPKNSSCTCIQIHPKSNSSEPLARFSQRMCEKCGLGLIQKVEQELALCKVEVDQQKAIIRLNFQAGDPPSLNPHLATDIHSDHVAHLLFEGLTRITVAGKVEYTGAEKIEISPCGRHYTFHLRPNFWSNGEAVTAYHFERSWKRALMGIPLSVFSNFFFSIKNCAEVFQKRLSIDSVGILAQNSTTLKVELEEPTPYFLHLIATPPFFPLRRESAEPTEFNGPFTLGERCSENFLLLSPNPFYWNSKQVNLGGIKITMVRDPYAAYEMFKQGELDLVGDPLSPLPREIMQDSQIQPHLISKEVSRVYWIHCNMRVFPLHNAKLRRALSLALNRQKIVDRVFIKQIPQVSPLPMKYAQMGGDKEKEIYGNPYLARAYFKQALEELNLTKEEFPPLEINHSHLYFDPPLLEELQVQWKEVLGISLRLKALPWSEFSASLERGEFQLGGLFRRDFYNDPYFYLSFFKKGPNNPHSWEESCYEDLLKEYQSGNKRALKKIEQFLIEQAPVIPLINQRCFALVNNQIHGVDWNQGGSLDFTHAHFKTNS